MIRLVRFAAVLAAFVLLPLTAWASDWIATKASHDVNYAIDQTRWRPVTPGMVVPNKAWISTGVRGRVTLTRGKESITFQPNSMAAVIARGLFSRRTEVLQPYGTLAYEIETRRTPHTSVQTPFLAAVVKGTRFEISVTRRTASLKVTKGLVEVTSLSRGERTHVRPGQRVTVDPKNRTGMRVVGAGPKDPVVPVAPTTARLLSLDEIELRQTRSQDRQQPSGTSQNSGAGTGDGDASGVKNDDDSSPDRTDGGNTDGQDRSSDGSDDGTGDEGTGDTGGKGGN